MRFKKRLCDIMIFLIIIMISQEIKVFKSACISLLLYLRYTKILIFMMTFPLQFSHSSLFPLSIIKVHFPWISTPIFLYISHAETNSKQFKSTQRMTNEEKQQKSLTYSLLLEKMMI